MTFIKQILLHDFWFNYCSLQQGLNFNYFSTRGSNYNKKILPTLVIWMSSRQCRHSVLTITANKIKEKTQYAILKNNGQITN